MFQCWNVFERNDEDNVIAVLEHPDRISRIKLIIHELQLGKIATLTQKPFPVLTHLFISSHCGMGAAIPDEFLGGSAPSLQQLDVCDVLYPELQSLLLSASNLVNLSLHNIPRTGYISPKAMVSLVTFSIKLETLHIDFSARTSYPKLIISPPTTRTILPALRNFTFSGECKYLEDFISRIDTPQLDSISVYYQDWAIDFNYDVPQLSKFTNRSENLKRSLSRYCKIMVDQDQDIVTFCIGCTTSDRWDPKPGIFVCLGPGIDGQISHLTNILGFMSPILSDIVHCTIDSMLFMSESSLSSNPESRDDFDWFQLLRQLPSLQALFAFEYVAELISQAFAYVDVGTITEILPALQLLCIEELEDQEEDQTMSSVHKFLALRRDSGHPVTFVQTKEVFEEKLKPNP